MAESNDSFSQFNSVLMDVNRNESNGGKHVLGQYDSLSPNTVCTEFHNVESLCNKTNPFEVSGEILDISDIDVKLPKCGISDIDANLQNCDISDIDLNLPNSTISTGDVIVNNGGASAENENVPDAFITSENVDTRNKGTSGDCVYGSASALDENISDAFIAGRNTEFLDISDIDVNLPKCDISDIDANLPKCDISDIEVLSKCAISTDDVIVSNGGTSVENENIPDAFITSQNVDAHNRGTSGDDVFYGSASAHNEIISDAFIVGKDVSNKVTSAADMHTSNVCISSDDVFNGNGKMLCDFSKEINDGQVIKDEEFHDAVQFFKDPSSLHFLENVGSSNTEPESLTRSSVYIKFDPLHERFNSQPTKKSSELDEISEVAALIEVPELVAENCSEFVNKHLANVSPQEPVSNILISFDSPVKGKPVDEAHITFNGEPPKLYTENEVLQIVKDKKLNLQETFLKREHELELENIQKLNELEIETNKKNILCTTLYNTLKDVADVAISMSIKNKALQESIESIVKENTKLQEDLKTSMEDLQSFENTFTDFHKRYEQCKGMLKVYTQNEINMKQVIENINSQLVEKDEIYEALKSRTEEMLNKSNIEIANVKKTCDASVTVLDAQLKKSELKISSLENELKHVKIENDKLTSICDELMVKVSEG